jgi:hypothetical protein
MYGGLKNTMINVRVFVTQTRFEDGRSAIKIHFEFPHKAVLKNIIVFGCTQISRIEVD